MYGRRQPKETHLNMTTTAALGSRGQILVDTRATGDAAATATIASISDQDWYISRTHGVYHIPACAKGEAYSVLLITSRGDAIDLGDNRRFPFTISARAIAEDLLQDLHDHGVFLCVGARPTHDELSVVTARRDEFYQRLVTVTRWGTLQRRWQRGRVARAHWPWICWAQRKPPSKI